MDDINKKEAKYNKYRKTTINYKFLTPKKIYKNEFQSLIFALAKKNYINKLFNKDNNNIIISQKLAQFLNVKKIWSAKENNNNIKENNKDNINNDKENQTKKNNETNNVVKESYENGLQVEITYEENEEYVKVFENQFLKAL